MRLIDADKLRENWLYGGENESIYNTNDVLESIDEQPTIETRLEVVTKEPKDYRFETPKNLSAGLVTEYCHECEQEVLLHWGIRQDGYKAFCPYCGNRLMLCSECKADGFNCDYKTKTDTCQFNKKNDAIYYDAKDIASWFLTYNDKVMIDGDSDYISNLKLQKLLYYAQGTYMALKDKCLFKDDIKAWKHGAVVEAVYSEYKHNKSAGIEDYGEFNPECIDEDTRIVLEDVYDFFGQYSTWKLENMIHEETPWKETALNETIRVESIKKYFLENYIEKERTVNRNEIN